TTTTSNRSKPGEALMHRPFRRLLVASAAAGLCALAAAAPAFACAGLVTPGGNVKLTRASTLAAWADGYEHYVTSFTFQGGGAEFGSIVPLPGVPSKVERAGDWTLQRLEREVAPKTAGKAAADCSGPNPCPEAASAAPAEEISNTRIDALDITILRGGGESVGVWARDHGFQLTPDAPEVLDFYAARSPIFMAARFNADAAKQRDQPEGEGTPIHLTIPMDNPWVPLRILGLGKGGGDPIDANVFLLTPAHPNLLPDPRARSAGAGATPSDEAASDGVIEERSEPASKSLLDDLRSDKGMEWVPQSMWFTYLRIGEQSSRLRYDLAIDKVGGAKPSRVMAGLDAPPPAPQPTTSTTAAPTTTTAKPRPQPRPKPPVTPTTAAPVPPTTAVVTDPTLPVIVEPPTTAAPATLALPPALDAGHGRNSGPSAALLFGATGGGALAAGLAAWTVQTRLRRRSSQP
ncbi:MAG TPA: DUF2330 domain-containing protein, partial [Acidimicrobiia bacterium]|nr:DUF2330 domain-containing protein [Acidimicrobiia bacterium]